jgi:hypothetical protein
MKTFWTILVGLVVAVFACALVAGYVLLHGPAEKPQAEIAPVPALIAKQDVAALKTLQTKKPAQSGTADYVAFLENRLRSNFAGSYASTEAPDKLDQDKRYQQHLVALIQPSVAAAPP